LGCDLDLNDGRDLIVVGEILEASWLDLDLCYALSSVDKNRERGGGRVSRLSI